MGFSLSGLINRGINDVKSVVNRPQPAQLPNNQMAPQAVAKIQNAKYGVLAQNPARQQQFIHSVQVPKFNAAQQILPTLKQQAPRVGEGIGLGIGRSLAGTAQAASGLVDLVTPGLGTSRVSSGLNHFAQHLDAQAKNAGVTAIYKPTQAIADTAQFLIPGAGEAKLATMFPKVAKASEFAGKLTAPTTKLVDSAATNLAARGAVGRIAGAGLKGGVSGSNLINAAAGTALQQGQAASKGQDISLGNTGLALGGNLAFGAALPAGAQATGELGRATIKSAKSIDRSVQAAAAKKAANENLLHQQKQLDREHAAIQQQIQKTPVQNTIANNTLASKADRNRFQYNSLEAQKQKLSLPEKVITAPVGLGMKAVHDSNLHPDQNQFIEDYASILKDQGQGNGVNLVPNGEVNGLKRTSNNYRAPGMGSGKLTNADYFDQARKEIESGKAPFGLSDHYKELTAGLKAENAPKPATTLPDINSIIDETNAVQAAPKPTPVQPTTPTKQLPPAARADTGTPASKQLPVKSVVSPSNSSKQRGFVTSVKASDEVSGKTKQMTTGKYQPRNTAKLQAGAEKVASGNLTKATKDVTSALEKQVGTITDKDVANSIAVAKAHDAKGNVQQSSDIYEKLAEHLTKQGQSIQAASLLSHQTPEGLQYGAQKALKKAGVELTAEVQASLKSAIDEVRSAKPGTERDYAVKKLQKLVSDHTPTSVSDKLSSIWKAGLLTGVKTQTGNWLSNGTFQVLHAASNPLAVGIDKAISRFTGVRTKSLTAKGMTSGLGEGVSKGWKSLSTGIDERKAIDNKYDTHGEVNFKNKALNTYVNGVFRLMGAADRPTYYSQLRNSLHDLALTDAANKGIPRNQVTAHVKGFLNNPPANAFQAATNEAEKSVLANDTALSTLISGVRQSTDRIKNPLARGTASTAINVLAPFTKVPSAFLNRVIDFSPVGAVKEAAMQMSEHKLDQRVLSTALSEATTGSALIYLGYQAAKNNLLSGNYPQNDPKEAQRWKADGIQPNSIKVGDKWLSLNYFGPLGLLFNAGQRVNDAAKQGQDAAGKTVAAVAGAPKDLMGQSFLQGLSGFTNAINDPTRSAKTYLNSQVSSIIPTIAGDVAQATDKMQRQADTVSQSLQAKIPGVRKGLPAKQDIYGNPLSAKSGAASQLANPLRPSNDLSKGNPVLAEVTRLHQADTNNKDMQVTPSPVQKVVTIDKQKVTLTDKQRYDLQKQVGQTTQTNWGKLIKTPEYQKLDDTGKAKALSNLRSDSATLATRQYVTDNNLGTYSKAVTAKQGSLASGNNLASYTKGSGTTGGGVTVNDTIDAHSQKVLNEYNTLDAATRKSKAYKENDYDYKVAQAKYDNAKANGSLTRVQDINQQQAVTKAKIGSAFSKDIRETYDGLDKSEIYNLITTDPNGKQIASDLLSYGDALANATGSQNKFRTSKGVEAFAPKPKGGSRGGLGRTSFSLYSGKNNPLTHQKMLSALIKNAHVGKASKRLA